MQEADLECWLQGLMAIRRQPDSLACARVWAVAAMTALASGNGPGKNPGTPPSAPQRHDDLRASSRICFHADPSALMAQTTKTILTQLRRCCIYTAMLTAGRRSCIQSSEVYRLLRHDNNDKRSLQACQAWVA
jgi:hypothetical protein